MLLDGNIINNKTLFDIGKTTITLLINNYQYCVTELNKPYSSGPTIYTPVYSTTTPRRFRKCTEIIIADDKVQRILYNSHGKTIIPSNGFVYVFNKSHNIDISTIIEGDPASYNITYSNEHNNSSWNSMDYIIASTPLLLKDGIINPAICERTSSFYIKRHPRTAVGVLSDGTWILLVVDGRQKISEGFTLLELAQYMQKLGCQHALNLDGGGSSTLVINGKVMNSPSGHEWSLVKKEKPVSHALLVMPRN